MRYHVIEGNYKKMGVQPAADGVTFTFEGAKEAECVILLYDSKMRVKERIPAPADYCMGAVRSVTVQGISAGHLAYNYEIDGEVCPDAYANRILGRDRWADTGRAECDYAVCCGYEGDSFDWQKDRRPEIPRHRMVMYKLHVRGFSMDAGIRGKARGTFAAVREKIPYLKELGVTTVEFMPVYEFEELMPNPGTLIPEYLSWESREDDLIKPASEKAVSDKINYWGYTKGSYFAVKASYAASGSPAAEWKELVRALHANGMECVMEVYVAENTNQNMILEALRYWVREYHVDGFHLLGDYVPVSLITQDVWLARTKLFYRGYEERRMPEAGNCRRLFVYSDEYLYPVRKMLNHCGGNLGDFICQQRKQHDMLGFVNYIADNNGFSLIDVFSYEEKHNEANGEDNYDGNNWNYSDNCGVEGRSNRRSVKELRERQLCNAFAILFCGQGVPLLYSGDELGNTQNGNNNAYCQDNPTGWVNWKKGSKYAWLTEFVRKMAAFRQAHPGIGADEPKKLSDFKRKGFPDLSYHGESAWVSEFRGEEQAVGMMYCGAYAEREDGSDDEYVYIGYNFRPGISRLALPKLPGKKKWYLAMDTSRGHEAFLEKEEPFGGAQIAIRGQSVMILTGK